MVDAFAPITSAPAWRGENLSGKRLVVCPEQGWGDQIMWGRYLPRLREAGAEVVVVCHPKLARLFERLGFWTKPAVVDRPIPDGDYWTLFGTLPRLGGPIPPAAYLDIPLARGGGVGVIPTGSPTYFNDANRSLFGTDAKRLLDLGRDIRPEATGLYDFSDTADLIAGLDLVITVDTAIANLAGSMGKTTWVLIPAVSPSYRWSEPWYPNLVQYRQLEPNGWSSVLDRVAAALAPRQSALQQQ